MKKVIAITFLIAESQIALSQADSSYFTVRLSAFDASVSNNITKLHWKTVCFLEYANFQIEKSVDAKNFITIHLFTADRLRCQQPFDFSDSSLSIPGTVFYRINVGNIDGKFYHSTIRRVDIKEKGFNLINVYPTIAVSSINFSITNSINEIFHAVIISQSGRIIKNKNLQVPKGLSNYNFETADLPPGYYWLKVMSDLGDSRTTKFVKQ
jgi:hypothetical protein